MGKPKNNVLEKAVKDRSGTRERFAVEADVSLSTLNNMIYNKGDFRRSSMVKVSQTSGKTIAELGFFDSIVSNLSI